MMRETSWSRARVAGAVLRVGCVGLLLGLLPGVAAAKVLIVASVNDLASIAAEVGGDEVETRAIAKPNADPHRVEILPSYMMRVSRAQLFLVVGLGLDRWAGPILDGSHNSAIRLVDCSQGIDPLEKPSGRVDASMGDVHPGGNPHYWLDPENGAIIARTIAEALSGVDPAHASDYAARADSFAERCRVMKAHGRAAAAAMPVRQILTYHRSWSYLAAAFGFDVIGTVEPVPGIPPTAKHLHELVALIEQHRVPLLLQEPYFSNDAARFLERETGLRVVAMPASCASAAAGSYLDHFASIIAALTGGNGE